ncbi:SDR family oxidoreductase [Mesorhizobium sp. CGMCC 1.15528]|uniref:SDR family oxidoreductase n=1 Tax=Mesorhizobium zhangyense TaxID=1776730 RepID=A0A7C9RBB1_9HYPH|nr:SDR family oxidoreductase [Mesorhizobium zhangyense]NGN44615.1 SDR family oxidoreductase [Mesorhizobium zhangyense]
MNNAFDLSGQRVFVTGAGGAIGGAAARACAALGADLAIVDLKAPDELARELHDAGTKVKAYALDNSIRADVEKVITEAGPLDALCDCSGYYVKGDWMDGGDDWETLYRKTMDVNVLGPVNLVRAVLPGMAERGTGRIALTTSMAARTAGSTLAVEPAYVASKGGLQAIVRYFARQVADKGIVVNAISPGPILTPLLISANQPFAVDHYPMKRLGKPEEIGWPLAFLCSRATGFMTGAVIDVNGGMAFS